MTNLLSNELDQQGNYLTPDENESPQKPASNEKYQSLSSNESSVSSDEGLDDQTPSQNKTPKAEDEKNFAKAVEEIENDVKILTAVIQQASHNKKEDQSNGQQKKHTFDEDDDTSKQATQNYDLHDNEQEVRNTLSLFFFSYGCL